MKRTAVFNFRLLLGILFFTFHPESGLALSTKIGESVLSTLQVKATADVIVSLEVGTGNILQEINEKNFLNSARLSRTNRIENVVTGLRNHAAESQKNVLNFITKIKTTSVSVQTLWVSNQIYLKNVNLEFIDNLAQLEDIRSIELNEAILLSEPEIPEEFTGQNEAEMPWGIYQVEAAEVWAMNGGNAGEGVIVATIDTGVRATHEALRDNYIGEYGWLDPYENVVEPYDPHEYGHGTHVTGTIAGKLGIGVAPNATWMSCLGCASDGCYAAELILCGQFAICPTLPDGSQPNCAKAAHIVSNSWAGGQGTTFYNEVVDAWHAAGIIPVFAQGNEGNNFMCRTANSPGDNIDVIGVGATANTTGIAWFSGLGPTAFGTMKPDISAPGVAVRSSVSTSDTSYLMLSGTSMACPHVAGVIALMKSAYPELTYEQTKTYLFNGAKKDGEMTDIACSGLRGSHFPNHVYGHGRVSALNSVVNLLNGEKCNSGITLVLNGYVFAILALVSYCGI